MLDKNNAFFVLAKLNLTSQLRQNHENGEEGGGGVTSTDFTSYHHSDYRDNRFDDDNDQSGLLRWGTPTRVLFSTFR